MVEEKSLLSIVRFLDLEKWSVDLSTHSLFAFQQMQKLSKVMKRVKDAIIIEDTKKYKRITVKLYGNGVIERDKAYGKDIGTKRQFKAKAGQLIISRIDARNGAFGIVPDELDGAIVTNDFWIFDVFGADIKFLILVLSSPRFQVYWQGKSNGTTNRQRVDEKDFMSCKIPVIDIKKQNELVKKYEDRILQAEACEREIEFLEAKVEEYLFNMLGIVIKQSTDIAPSGFLKTTRFKEIMQWGYEKNAIPFPYGFVKNTAFSFFDMPKWCVSLVRGKSPKYAEASAFSILNQKCNRWDEIDLSYVKSVDSAWIERVEKGLFTKINDILINSTGEGTLGRASLIKEEQHTGLLFDSHMMSLRVNEDFINPQLLVYLINSSFGQKQIEILKGAQATKQTELGVENMKKIVFPLPEKPVQNEIVGHITEIKDQIKALRKKSDSLCCIAKKEFEDVIFGK